MTWYWTDDLARVLIDSGAVERSRVVGWLSCPVAVRGDSASSDEVARVLLGEEEDDPPWRAVLAA